MSLSDSVHGKFKVLLCCVKFQTNAPFLPGYLLLPLSVPHDVGNFFPLHTMKA
jgi:hypothetical protein